MFILLPLLFFVAVAKVISLAPESGAATDIPTIAVEGLPAGDLDHQFAVVNFFASWCGPCAAEIPVLMKISSQNITVYGIDSLDNPGDLDRFLRQRGNPFKKIGSDPDGTISAAWDVTGVPVSFVIADGKIFRRFEGPLTDADAETIINAFRKRRSS
jgi:cytochrome c biogenesis protein CcmG/thiol:disulfide interchange protein DsbE